MKLLYFAWVREKLGISDEEVDLPASVTTVAELLEWQQSRGETYANAFTNSDTINTAINQTHVDRETSLQGATEIAFFPPVTGG